MGDLHCAATVIVARHAKAQFADPQLISDDGGTLSAAGRAQSLELAQRMAIRRVAAVVTSPMGRAQQTAQIVADELGVNLRVLPGLREFSVGDAAGTRDDAPLRQVMTRWLDGQLDERVPGGESAREVIARFRGELDDIADEFRGETVLAITHGMAMSLAVPRLCANASRELTRLHLIPNCASVDVEIDEDGWRMGGPWPGQPWPDDLTHD